MERENIKSEKRGSYISSNSKLTINIFPEISDNVGVFIIVSLIILFFTVLSFFSSSLIFSIFTILLFLIMIYANIASIARTNKEINITKEVISIQVKSGVTRFINKINLNKIHYSNQIIITDTIKDVFFTKLSSRIRGNLYRLILKQNDEFNLIIGDFSDLDFVTNLKKDIIRIINIEKK
jgi:hypothetical protein